MKELHLVCESHLDPVWLWEWEEGASAAISTFQSAVNLAEDFDYIFCHNEVTLYKYIEEYTPELFADIQRLVKAGKWHIMGGWYLQPDANMPMGESFVRQIQVGKMYFKEKFDKAPTTAINFDSFGHTRGLVQIIKKCGQDSYIFVRPFSGEGPSIPDDFFWWKGFDGSMIKAFRSPTYNSSAFGNGRNHIRGVKDSQDGREAWLCLWGVGNHGGGPSRQDLIDIEEYAKECETKIIHSTPEAFFSKYSPREDAVADYSMRTSMPGCYISMSNLKRRHIALENAIYSTEKALSLATLSGAIVYPQESLDEAVEDLVNAEFHDILPGSAIKKGEANGVRFLEHGLQIVNKLKARAFFAMSQGEPVAEPGEYPVLVFNAHPYELDTNVEVEFNLAEQNHNTEIRSLVHIFDGEKELVSQHIREDANLNLDWRKRIIFRATLPPMSVKRFRMFVEMIPRPGLPEQPTGNYVFDNGEKHVEISRETGLITSYIVGGREYLKGGAFAPYLYDDNSDPWGMSGWQHESMGRNPVAIPYTDKLSGAFRGRVPFQIVEDGAIMTAVETFFQCEHVGIRMLYRIYKDGRDVDITANVIWGERDKMLKLHIPTTAQNETFTGQTSFGTETVFNDGRETVSHRFVSVGAPDDKERLTIINNCIYGSSEKDGEIRLSLIRGAAYAGHPIGDLPITPERYVNAIDQGEHEFNFRLSVMPAREMERCALEFNQQPFALNVFPTGKSPREIKPITLLNSNPQIILSTIKNYQNGKGYVIRLFNGCDENASTVFTIGEASVSVEFTPYEVKTFIFDPETAKFTESYEMVI